MISELIFEESDKFQVIGITKKEGKVCIDVSSIQLGSNCPLCNKRSFKHHSYYVRRFLDLPVLGNETWIRLKARKFYCTTDSCTKKVFTERFDIHFKSSKRMTDKVREKLLKVALLMGGNGGEKICHLMNMPVSSSTLIRSLHAEPIPEIQASTIIGLDDWAYRKGRKYGTVLVDLEKQKIIDLLPDRESSTVEKWLRDHPQIKIVSRDRYANYAIGINKALPEAIHVADRWHLIKNLGEVVKKVLDRVRVALKQKAKMLYAPQYSTPISRAALPTRTIQSLERKQKLIDEVKRLFGQGVSMLAISKTLQLNRITVKNYLSLEKAMPKNCISRTNLHLFENYIRDAVAKRPGVLIRDLYHEIKAMGYDGSRSVGYARIGNYMNTFSQEHYLKDIPQANWKPADVSFLFYKKASELHSRERDIVNYIINVSGEAETCYLLFQRFREMIENKDGAGLDKWIKDAKATLIKEFHTFSLGVLNDFSAVQNAFNLPWSNGQVEGQVNKLKMIKRQMYGRASFNLLRKRLVCIE